MKPIKLIISAFGPFAKQTAVDFEALGSDGVFLITGDTGAGKTTVFDAISFALFGEASGGNERRSARSFRSDYASPDDVTYVEYTFAHKGKQYRILRRPEYDRAKKTGKGTTKEKSHVEIEDLSTGEVIDNTELVNGRIGELIGLTQDQFAQTVMIAQGDFLKILNAKSAERRVLFQKLFNTSVYTDIQKNLLKLSNACEDEKKALNSAITTAAGKIEAAEDFPERDLISVCKKDPLCADKLLELLGSLVEADKKRGQELREQKQKNRQSIDELIRQVAEGRTLNADFDALGKAVERSGELSAMQDEMDRCAKELGRARRAQSAETADALSTKADADLKELEIKKNSAKEQLDKSKLLLPSAKEALTKAQGELSRAEELGRQADRYENALPVLKAFVSDRTKLEGLERKVEGLRKKSGEADRHYIEIKAAYYSSKYGLIAQELQEGEPCPVCGSTEHPAPARMPEVGATQEELEAAEDARGKANDALVSMDSDISVLRATLESERTQLTEAGIAPDTTAGSLREKIKGLRNEAKELNGAFERAQSELHGLENSITACQSAFDSLRDQTADALEKQKDCADAFRTALTDNGFADEADYRDAKRLPKQISVLDGKLRKFNEEKKSCGDRISELSDKLAGRKRIDVDAMEAECNAAQKMQEEIEAREKREDRAASRNADALREITAARRSQKSREGQWAVIHDVYRLVAGQPAPGQKIAKITFETYVQQHYFKQVVAAANLRLYSLTDGKFTLRCKETAKDLKTQSGLDLDVLDRATGQWRDVSTLSGGESFMASLALALGLSDVVQSGSGSVRLDSMFIDEGFGTLDENSLNRALETLDSLADGKRLIGVISHVPELRERIDKRIEIRKTPTGSTILCG